MTLHKGFQQLIDDFLDQPNEYIKEVGDGRFKLMRGGMKCLLATLIPPPLVCAVPARGREVRKCNLSNSSNPPCLFRVNTITRLTHVGRLADDANRLFGGAERKSEQKVGDKTKCGHPPPYPVLPLMVT